MSNRTFHVVHCAAIGEPGAFDESEIRSVHWRSPEQVKEMIRTGQIDDGFSLTALLYYLADL